MERAGISVLPEDLIIEILIRLPLMAILKFMCVSKSWRSLISSKRFVRAHLDFSAHKNVRVITEKIILKKTDPIQLQQHNLNNASRNKFDDDQGDEFYYPLSNKAHWFRFIGSHNGLCCALIGPDKYCYSLFVWNPLTRKSRNLSFGCVGYVIGFGFDGDDYKVLAVYNEFRSDRKVVTLYSSRTSAWKQVEADNLRLPTDTGTHGIFANGKLYWMNMMKKKRELVYFDLGSQVYGTVELPPSSLEADAVKLLTGECIALISIRGTSLDVWISKLHGSWNKVISINAIDDFLRCVPRRLTGDREIRFRSRLKGFICYVVPSLVSPFPDDCDLMKQGDKILVAK